MTTTDPQGKACPQCQAWAVGCRDPARHARRWHYPGPPIHRTAADSIFTLLIWVLVIVPILLAGAYDITRTCKTSNTAFCVALRTTP